MLIFASGTHMYFKAERLVVAAVGLRCLAGPGVAFRNLRGQRPEYRLLISNKAHVHNNNNNNNNVVD